MICIKISLFVIGYAVLFMFIAETTITLKPFSIHCNSIMKAIGITLILSGVIILNEYYYKKGIHECIKMTKDIQTELIDEMLKDNNKEK